MVIISLVYSLDKYFGRSIPLIAFLYIFVALFTSLFYTASQFLYRRAPSLADLKINEIF